MNSLIKQIVCTALVIQLSVGSVYINSAFAQSTNERPGKKGPKNEVPPVPTATELILAFNGYVEGIFKQCYDKDENFNPNLPFTSPDRILANQPAANCGQAAIVVSKIYPKLEKLHQEYVPNELKEKNCVVNCGASPVDPTQASTTNSTLKLPALYNVNTEKLSCSVSRQKTIAAEECNGVCLMTQAASNIINTATLGIAGNFINGYGCPASVKKTGWDSTKNAGKCFEKLMGGLFKSLRDMFVGTWDLLKLIGTGIYSGAAALKHKLFDASAPVEKASRNAAHALQGETNESIQTKEKKGFGEWLKDGLAKFSAGFKEIMKEVFYINGWDRDSLCMDCFEKSQLMCEVISRIGTDWIVSGILMGRLNKMLPIIAKKLGPITGPITKQYKNLKIAAEKGSKAAKIGVGAAKVVDHAVVKPLRLIGALTLGIGTFPYRKITGSKQFKKLLEHGNKPENIITDAAANGAAHNSVPGEIIIDATHGKNPVAEHFDNQDVLFNADPNLKETTAAGRTSELAKNGKVEEANNIAMTGENGSAQKVLITQEVKPEDIIPGPANNSEIKVAEGAVAKAEENLAESSGKIVDDANSTKIPPKNGKKEFKTDGPNGCQVNGGINGKIKVGSNPKLYQNLGGKPRSRQGGYTGFGIPR